MSLSCQIRLVAANESQCLDTRRIRGVFRFAKRRSVGTASVAAIKPDIAHDALVVGFVVFRADKLDKAADLFLISARLDEATLRGKFTEFHEVARNLVVGRADTARETARGKTVQHLFVCSSKEDRRLGKLPLKDS